MENRDYTIQANSMMLDAGPGDGFKHSRAEGNQILMQIRDIQKKKDQLRRNGEPAASIRMTRKEKAIKDCKDELRRILKENGADPGACDRADTPADLSALVDAHMPPAAVIRRDLYTYLFNNYSVFKSPGEIIGRLVDALGDQTLFREGDSVRLRIVKQFLEYAPYQTTTVVSTVLKRNGKGNIRVSEKKRQTALALIDESIFDSMGNDSKWDLLHLADDLANGKFRTNGKTRRHLYLFAFAFGIHVLSPQEWARMKGPGDVLRYQDLERNLLCDYCNACLVQKMAKEYSADPGKSGYDMWPSGTGINYKNWLEALFLYYLHRNHQLIEAGRPAAERRDLFGEMLKMEEKCQPRWKKRPDSKSKGSSREVTFLAQDPDKRPVPGVRVLAEELKVEKSKYIATGRNWTVSADGKGGALTLNPAKYRITAANLPKDFLAEEPFILTVIGDGKLGVDFEVPDDLEDPAVPVPVFLVRQADVDVNKGFSVGFQVLDLAGAVLDQAAFPVCETGKGKEKEEAKPVLTVHAVVGRKEPVFEFLKPGTYQVRAEKLPADLALEGAVILRVTGTGRVFVNNALCEDGVVTLHTRPLMTRVYRDRYQELISLSGKDDLEAYLRANYSMSEYPKSAGYITVREDLATAEGICEETLEQIKEKAKDDLRADGDDPEDLDLAYRISLEGMQEGTREVIVRNMKERLKGLGVSGLKAAAAAFDREISMALNKKDSDLRREREAEDRGEKRDFGANLSRILNEYTESRRKALVRFLDWAVSQTKGTNLEEECGRIAAEYCEKLDALDRFDNIANDMAESLKLDSDGKNDSKYGGRGRTRLIRLLWHAFRINGQVYPGESFPQVFFYFKEYCEAKLEACRCVPLEMKNLFDAFAVLMLFSVVSVQQYTESRI